MAYLRVSAGSQNLGNQKLGILDYARQKHLAEGIALAKQRGAYRGRNKSLSPEQAAQLRQRVRAGERKAPLAPGWNRSTAPRPA